MCAIVIEPKVKEMLCHFKLGVYFYHFVKKTTTKVFRVCIYFTAYLRASLIIELQQIQSTACS